MQLFGGEGPLRRHRPARGDRGAALLAAGATLRGLRGHDERRACLLGRQNEHAAQLARVRARGWSEASLHNRCATVSSAATVPWIPDSCNGVLDENDRAIGLRASERGGETAPAPSVLTKSSGGSTPDGMRATRTWTSPSHETAGIRFCAARGPALVAVEDHGRRSWRRRTRRSRSASSVMRRPMGEDRLFEIPRLVQRHDRRSSLRRRSAVAAAAEWSDRGVPPERADSFLWMERAASGRVDVLTTWRRDEQAPAKPIKRF